MSIYCVLVRPLLVTKIRVWSDFDRLFACFVDADGRRRENQALAAVTSDVASSSKYGIEQR